ncbi:very short patch repair endonuclease [Archangium sp. Cb G35]|uniref:very short patch repair endonuclease n=1 Tax=Archangium sp. Cb G35 TaxID=1920190 RepID=UPI0035168B0D
MPPASITSEVWSMPLLETSPMADTLSRAARSENMRRIRATDTEPEVAVRRALHRMGLRFRLHARELPGKPDVVLRRHNAVVLIHGCFWHQHRRCIDGRVPKSNTGYWQPKLERNVQRDRRNRRQLSLLGFRVLVVWECEARRPEVLERKLRRFFPPGED